MRIKNNTTGNIIISDLPSGQGAGLSVPSQVEILIYNEDAEKSNQLGSFLTSGHILNLGPEEPSTGGPQSQSQPAAIGAFPVEVTNAPSAGKALVAQSAATARWESTGGTVTFIDGEAPAGAINNVNKIFTLAHPPTSGSVHFYKNGLRQTESIDYTIVGQTLTLDTAPTTLPVPTVLIVDYRL